MKKVVYLLLFLFSNGVLADCNSAQCTNVKITLMYVTPNGNTVISTSGDESKLSCEAGSSGYIEMITEQKNYEATYSLMLMAHTTGHPITVKTTGSGSCSVQYIVSYK